MGRHSEPGTGAPAPDRGFWVRAGVVGLAVVLAGTYLLVRRGDDGSDASNVATRSTGSATATPTGPTGLNGSPTPAAASASASPGPSGAELAPTLAFRVLRDSYITVRVPGGATLVSKVFHKGQQRSFDRRVLQVVNGRPSAVRFTVNGAPRDPGRADRVETFTVRRP